VRSWRRPRRNEPKNNNESPFFTVRIDTHSYGEYFKGAASSALAQDFHAEQREVLAVMDALVIRSFLVEK
jgi:hypothetical protein